MLRLMVERIDFSSSVMFPLARIDQVPSAPRSRGHTPRYWVCPPLSSDVNTPKEINVASLQERLSQMNTRNYFPQTMKTYI